MEDEMGGACNTHWGDENYVYNFGRKIWKKETSWENNA